MSLTDQERGSNYFVVLLLQIVYTLEGILIVPLQLILAGRQTWSFLQYRHLW